jgi:hypothetical protein
VLAFNEDRDILTAQQRIIDADPTRGMALFDVDRAPVMYRRLVQQRLDGESGAADLTAQIAPPG